MLSSPMSEMSLVDNTDIPPCLFTSQCAMHKTIGLNFYLILVDRTTHFAYLERSVLITVDELGGMSVRDFLDNLHRCFRHIAHHQEPVRAVPGLYGPSPRTLVRRPWWSQSGLRVGPMNSSMYSLCKTIVYIDVIRDHFWRTV